MKQLPLYPFYLLLFVLAACTNDPAGSLEVNVSNADGVQGGVTVTLDPGGAAAMTDASGWARFPDLPPVDYLVSASHPELGSNSALVSVQDEEEAGVYLRLPGRYNQPPEVEWHIPHPDYNYDQRQSEILSFSATILDDRDPEGTVSYVLTSDLDGTLLTGVDSAGYFDRISPQLSRGQHTLTLTATDSEGLQGGASVQVTIYPDWPTITLFEPVAEGDALRITWSSWPDSSFATYQLLRHTPYNSFMNTLAVIENREDTVYTDRTVPFNKWAQYAVQVTYKPEFEHIDEVRSEIIETELAYGRIDLESPLHELLSDPKRNLLYGADREHDRVVIIDVQSRQVSRYVAVGSQPEDLALSPNGDTLFVANSGSNSISVIDLATKQLARTLTLPPARYGLRFLPERIAALTGGRLALIGSEGPSGLFLYRPDLDTLTYLTRASPTLQNFAVSPDFTVLYVAEDGGGGQQVKRYVTTPDGNLSLQQSSPPGNGGPRCVLSSDGQYVFFEDQKFPADDLSRVLVTFPDPYNTDIRLSNRDGTKVMGQYAYYDGTTGARLGPVREDTYLITYDPVRNLSFHHTRYTRVVTVIPFP